MITQNDNSTQNTSSDIVHMHQNRDGQNAYAAVSISLLHIKRIIKVIFYNINNRLMRIYIYNDITR